MSYIVEPTITCILWKILEEKLGLRVGGELNVGLGRVDLVARDPTGEYIGLEVKDLSRIQGNSKKELEFVDQILKYMISGYFDYFYTCVPKSDALSLEITLNPQHYLNPVSQFNYPEKYKRFEEYGGYLHSCGMLSIPIKGWNVDFSDLIIRPPKQLTRSREPKIPQTNEARIRFDVWNHFSKIKGAPPICEGVLPNPEGNEPQRIDVMVFEGNTSPTEIFRNQHKFNLIGIEVKTSKNGHLGNAKLTKRQLNLYLNSGGLTQLYLAVPSNLEEDASMLLEDIPDVGLITVEKGITKVRKKAKRLEMKYDSIFYEKAGFQAYRGYRTKVSRRIIEIGWGRDAEEHMSPYQYSGRDASTDKGIHSKKPKGKRKMDEEQQTKRLDAWMK